MSLLVDQGSARGRPETSLILRSSGGDWFGLGRPPLLRDATLATNHRPIRQRVLGYPALADLAVSKRSDDNGSEVLLGLPWSVLVFGGS